MAKRTTVNLSDKLLMVLPGRDAESLGGQEAGELLARALGMNADEIAAQVEADGIDAVLKRYGKQLGRLSVGTIRKRMGLSPEKKGRGASNLLAGKDQPPPVDAVTPPPTTASRGAAGAVLSGKNLQAAKEESFRNLIHGVQRSLPKGVMAENVGVANAKSVDALIRFAQDKMKNSGSTDLARMSGQIDTYLRPLLERMESHPGELLTTGAWTPEQWQGLLTGGKATPDRAIEFWQKEGSYQGGTLPRLMPKEGKAIRQTWGAASLDTMASQTPMFTTPQGEALPPEQYMPGRKAAASAKAGGTSTTSLRDAVAGSRAGPQEVVPSPGSQSQSISGNTAAERAAQAEADAAAREAAAKANPSWFRKGTTWLGQKVKSAVTSPNEFLAGGAENRSFFQAAASGATRTAAGEAISATSVLSRLATSPFGLLALLAAPSAMRMLTGQDRIDEIRAQTMSPLEFAVAQKSAQREQQRQMQTMLAHPVLGPKLAKQMANAEQAQALELSGVPGYSTSDTY